MWHRAWPLAALGLGLFGFTFHAAQKPPLFRMVIYGDTNGYLAPCGCTSPMSGGITRAATVIRQLEGEEDGTTSFVLEGALISGVGRQDELKAECYSETAADEHANALAYGKEEAALGPGMELEMNSLSNGVLLQSQIDTDQPNLPQRLMRSGPFVIGAITRDPSTLTRQLGVAALSSNRAIEYLLSQCGPGDLPVLFTDGREQDAREIAAKYPKLRLIVFRSTTDPLSKPIIVGSTVLVTAGYHGKNVIEIGFQGGQETEYSATDLGPEVADDPTVSRVYQNYLRRVGAERLLSKLPRYATAAYAGSQKCAGCHETAYHTWLTSGHAHAYRDLMNRGHELDPDCVSCHVVGLSSTRGFRTEQATPQFANVGCESCHGPAAQHAKKPHQFLLQRVARTACDNCHTPDNSPGFVFSTYWPKVKH